MLVWACTVQRMEENLIPQRVLYMNLGTTRLRCRPRNRWQDEVREDRKPTIMDAIKLNRLHWFGHVQRMEEN